MSIEQHAEAAADAVFDLYVGAEPFTTGAIKAVVWNHAQFAIDEATAPLRDRIAELEKLWPLIEEYGEHRESSGIAGANCDRMERRRQDGFSDEAKSQITAILQGSATQPDPGSSTPAPGSSKTLP